eukprot:g24745.t1
MILISVVRPRALPHLGYHSQAPQQIPHSTIQAQAPPALAGLSCRPSVRAHDAKRDLALVVASDGLWDFVEEKDVGKVVTESSRNGLEHVAHRLVQEAQRSGSMDNISCLAIFL